MRLRLSLALLLLLLVPAATAVASGRDVLRDCADDEVLSKTYTQKEYRERHPPGAARAGRRA
jgi:hypothetical protein